MYSLVPIRTLLASFLFRDRPIAGDVRGSGDTVPSSAFKVGSIAVERSYCAYGSSYLVHQCQIGERRCPPIRTPVYTCQTTGEGGPNTLLLSHSSWFPYFRPVFGPEFPSFVPKRRMQRGVVSLRVRVTLALFHQNRPFIGPTRHLIGQLFHHVISGNVKRHTRYINYYNNTINRLP